MYDVLPDLFQATVRQFGANVAVECDADSLSYHQLEAASNQWANWLRSQGIGCGSRVALWLPRGIAVHTVLLGVLKAGAAYVPLDPEYPLDRVLYILENSQVRCLITTSHFASPELHACTTSYAIEEVLAQVQLASLDAPERAHVGLKTDDETYVIYTSGSTGRPKGVSISHRNVCHLVQAERAMFGIQPADRVFQGFSLAFDASVEEIWLAYCSGATLVIGTSELVRSGPELAERLAQKRITILSCVPTLLQMMGENVETVRLLIVGGEACPPNLVDRWARGSRRMFNTYGPTEATVIATWTECHANQPVTIGRPLPGYSAIIVDERMNPCAPGIAGELLLGGVGLSRGYVGLPDLTREKFIPNPFGELNAARSDSSSPPSTSKEKLYRTGDLCRFNDAGEIEYLGRIDAQVKIRGYRVELSEIEAVLLEHASVNAVSVMLREDHAGTKTLVAYVVPLRGCQIHELELREFARLRLPVYMIPALIEKLDELPTLPSGKIDRRSLPPPRPREIEAIDDGDASPIEMEILEAWRRIFSPLSVNVASDFFRDLSGDSLVAASMISSLRQKPQFRHASMFAIYQHPTVRAFAAAAASDGKIEESSAQDAVASAALEPNRQAETGWNQAKKTRYFACSLGQFIGLYFVLGLAGLQWLAPFLTYSYLDDSGYTIVASLIGGILALVSIYPPLVLLVVALKWLLLGRLRAGSYPLWSWFYWRWWFVRAVESVIPINYLVGTPLMVLYARMMGARIGRAVHLGSDSMGTYDLVSIGEGSSIGVDCSMLGYSVADGQLTLGPITIGRQCFVGTRTLLREHVTLEDGSRLEDLSMLPVGTVLGRGETWQGSPATCIHEGGPVTEELSRWHGTSWLRFWFGFAQTFGVFLMPIVVVAALLPGMAAVHHLNAADENYWYMLLSPAIGLSFVLLLSIQIVVLKWLVLGRVRPGVYPLYSGFSLRKWYIDQLLDLSVDVLGPLYSTLYLAPWYRALGAKIGRLAEISTASFISPDLLTLGDGSFIADIVSMGAARVEDGRITVDFVRVGSRSFVGNSAVIPSGTTLGNNCLIGCLSLPPTPSSSIGTGFQPSRVSGAHVEDGTSWVGSPSMQLPHRSINKNFSEEQTYTPSKGLIGLRLFIEFFRVVLPSAGFLSLAGLMFSFIAILRDWVDDRTIAILFPMLYAFACLLFVSMVIALKWIVMGRYRPLERPLWSSFVWRTELITALHDFFSGPILLESLRGTPFLAWYFRAMGTRIGRHVFLDSVQIGEFDLVRIDDEACLNSDATLQTHLFEDRVMKMSHVYVGPGCVVGAESLVLYDTQMQAGSTLGGLSLLMKGEILPAGTHWEGTPARRISTSK